MSDSEKTRRDMIAAAATGAAGLAVAGGVAAQPRVTQAQALNPNARAVLPNGSKLNRMEVLRQLGLDPTTPPDAWLAIVACGSNASALRGDQLRGLVSRGTLKATELDAVSRGKLNAR